MSLPYPRRRKSVPFLEWSTRSMRSSPGRRNRNTSRWARRPERPAARGLFRIPTINELAGLLEHLHEAPLQRADIYQLAKDLKVELNALLPLTEAAELLGFATIAEGDITLTPLGETFAEASIQARKEIFATRIRRLPLFKWLLAMLQAADTHQLEKDVLTTALELDFSPEEAARQVEVVINWGRYAELLAYNDRTASIDLENHSAAGSPPS